MDCTELISRIRAGLRELQIKNMADPCAFISNRRDELYTEILGKPVLEGCFDIYDKNMVSTIYLIPVWPPDTANVLEMTSIFKAAYDDEVKI